MIQFNTEWRNRETFLKNVPHRNLDYVGRGVEHIASYWSLLPYHIGRNPIGICVYFKKIPLPTIYKMIFYEISFSYITSILIVLFCTSNLYCSSSLYFCYDVIQKVIQLYLIAFEKSVFCEMKYNFRHQYHLDVF